MIQNDIRILLGTKYSRRVSPRGVSLPKTVSNELEVTGQSRWRRVQRKIAVATGTQYSHRDPFATTRQVGTYVLTLQLAKHALFTGKERKKEEPFDKGTGEMRNVRVLCRIKGEQSHTGSDRKVVSGGREGGREQKERFQKSDFFLSIIFQCPPPPRPFECSVVYFSTHTNGVFRKLQ